VIGSRLKHLDRLIEDTFGRVFTASGVTRRQWQALNVISRGPTGDEDLRTALKAFWETGEAAIADLSAKGWIERDATGLHILSPSGRTAHAAVHERVQGIRALMARDITPAEYGVVMDVLARMAHNLESGTMGR
jgi:DNA-binding MarR family transcriptional regulator